MREAARSPTHSSAKRWTSSIRRHLARPLVPGADVVARSVAGTLQNLGGEAGPASDVAVGDDLRAFGQANDRAHLVRAPALENPLEREVDGAGNVAMPRIAMSTGCAVELERRPHVDDDEPVLAEPPAQLGERHVFHWLTKSRSTALNLVG